MKNKLGSLVYTTILTVALLLGLALVSHPTTPMVMAQSNIVDLSNGYAQQARAGDTVVYTHILTNGYTETASIALQATSSRNWPLELSFGPDETPYIGAIQLEAGMTTTVQIELTVPLTETVGVSDTTTLVASGLETLVMYSDSLEDITTVAPATRYIYLPLVMRSYPAGR
ncbi:MAG TPA: hypothetical protein PKH77_09530 [Anaerolineae bacterium]|nr:hypothetical protein [Anaerolineae bacterium]